MAFMASLLLVLLVPMFHWVRAFQIARATTKPNTPAKMPLFINLAVLPIGVLSAGFLVGAISAAGEFRPDRDVNYAPYLFLVGGAIGAALYGYAAIKKGSWWIPCALASAYLCFTGIDHLAFVVDKETTGIVSSDIARSAGVDCDAAYLLVRKVGHALEYRCRKNIQLGNQLGTPFIPWPSYASGSSEPLLAAVDKLQADAADVAQGREPK